MAIAGVGCAKLVGADFEKGEPAAPEGTSNSDDANRPSEAGEVDGVGPGSAEAAVEVGSSNDPLDADVDLGCNAPACDADTRDAVPVTTYRLDEAEQQDRGYFGSSEGGQTFGPSGCGIREVMVGASFNSDPVPYKITPHCATVDSSGDLGMIRIASEIGTANSGPTTVTTDCAGGRMAVGIHGGVNPNGGAPFVGHLGLTCSPLKGWVDARATSIDLAEAGTTAGDTLFSDRCDMGYAMRAFSGRKGALFDGIQARCVHVIKETK